MLGQTGGRAQGDGGGSGDTEAEAGLVEQDSSRPLAQAHGKSVRRDAEEKGADAGEDAVVGADWQ